MTRHRSPVWSVALAGAMATAPQWVPALRRGLVGWQQRRRPTQPIGPPIERLAADLRRLRPLLDDGRRSRVQREAARLAYEDVLRDACRALTVEHNLDHTAGFAREVEILRVEHALGGAGLSAVFTAP